MYQIYLSIMTLQQYTSSLYVVYIAILNLVISVSSPKLLGLYLKLTCPLVQNTYMPLNLCYVSLTKYRCMYLQVWYSQDWYFSCRYPLASFVFSCSPVMKVTASSSLCSFYEGSIPSVMILDLEMLKEVLVKQFDSFEDRPVWQLHKLINEPSLESTKKYGALSYSTTKKCVHV